MRIFHRGDERLTLHTRESGRGLTLVVSGDGDLRSYSFHDAAALMKFESEMEDFLLHSGWAPAQVTTEPRPVVSLPEMPHRRQAALTAEHKRRAQTH